MPILQSSNQTLSSRLLIGDCREKLRGIPPNTFTAVVTDPPYGLEFMGKEWDAPWKTGMAEYGMADTKGRIAGPQFGSKRNPVCLSCHKHKRGRNCCKCKSPEYDETPASENQRLQLWHRQWAIEVLRVCKPGAMLLAFGGTRTHHRLMCAIEDAGWEIRDTIMWVYGSGFPKSHNISKAIDKAARAEREVVGVDAARAALLKNQMGEYVTDAGWSAGSRSADITTPATSLAQLWDGWGTALKPAFEPIVLAMKPLDGTFAQNAEKHGVAGLNVDGCRVGVSGGTRKAGSPSYVPGNSLQGSLDGSLNGGGCGEINKGRWPANLIHDGSDEVLEVFPEQQSPAPYKRIGKYSGQGRTYGGDLGVYEEGDMAAVNYGDSGSAARFFKQCTFSKEDEDLLLLRAKAILEAVQSNLKRRFPWKVKLANTVDNSLPLSNRAAVSVLSRVVTEASQGARQLSGVQGLSMNVTPKLLRQLCENVIILILSTERESLHGSYHIGTAKLNGNLAKFVGTPKRISTTTTTTSPTILDGSAVVAMLSYTKSNTVHGAKDSKASRLFYCAKASKSERTSNGQVENKHPTVKPLKLMEYLVKLVTMPKGTYILDPFCGSGSTLVACKRLGVKYVGIDSDPKSIRTTSQRLRKVIP